MSNELRHILTDLKKIEKDNLDECVCISLIKVVNDLIKYIIIKEDK